MDNPKAGVSNQSTNNSSNSTNQSTKKKGLTIEMFLDMIFMGRNEEIKSIAEKMESQSIETCVKVLCSQEFRNKFYSSEAIQKLSEEEKKLFEDLFIMTPLNYNYWRDFIRYEQLFKTTNQGNNPICWSHAYATGTVLASQRIIGRKKLNFEEIKQELLNEFRENVLKKEGVSPDKELSRILPKYNLRYWNVPVDQINHYNPHDSYRFYICTFSLKTEQWNDFYTFYNSPSFNPHDILKPEDLCKSKGDPKNSKFVGHAVILLDKSPYKFTFLNSWGLDWGDQGKFYVQKDAIPNMKFYEIYWKESDLSDEEKTCYKKRREKAIEIFYQIIDYMNFFIPN